MIDRECAAFRAAHDADDADAAADAAERAAQKQHAADRVTTRGDHHGGDSDGDGDGVEFALAVTTGGGSDDDPSGGGGGRELRAALAAMWPCALALYVTVATSLLIFPFFAYMRSSSGDALLPEVRGLLLSASLLLAPSFCVVDRPRQRVVVVTALACDGRNIAIAVRATGARQSSASRRPVASSRVPCRSVSRAPCPPHHAPPRLMIYPATIRHPLHWSHPRPPPYHNSMA